MNFLKYWLPPLLWAGFIVWISSLPIKAGSETNFTLFMGVKKLTHILEYGFLWILIYRLLAHGYNAERKKASYWAIILLVIWGSIDEYHQGLTLGSGGQPHVHDVFIDFLGGLATCLLVWNILPKMPKRLKNLAENLEIL